MSDIVQRLRAPAYWFSGSDEGHEGDNSVPSEAADEIDRLRASERSAWNAAVYRDEQIDRLRAAIECALRQLADGMTVSATATLCAALGEKA